MLLADGIELVVVDTTVVLADVVADILADALVDVLTAVFVAVVVADAAVAASFPPATLLTGPVTIPLAA